MGSDLRIETCHYSALPTNSASPICRPDSPPNFSSIPSTLESLQHEQVAGFFENWGDDCYALFKNLMRRFFPCLFSSEETVTIPVGPIPPSILDRRVSMAKNYLANQLRPRVDDYPRNPDSEWTTLGILPELIQNSKVVVFLKYNGRTDFCYSQMNGQDSLDTIKRVAMQKLETLLRHPDNREAHLTEFSVSTYTYSAPALFRRTIPCYSLNKQNRRVTINPDNSLSSRSNGCGGCDGYFSRETKDQTMEFIRENVPSAQDQTELQQFLF